MPDDLDFKQFINEESLKGLNLLIADLIQVKTLEAPSHSVLVSPDGIIDPAVSVDNNGDVTLAGDLIITGDLAGVDNLFLAACIIHTGDIDTEICFSDDALEATIGGLSMLKLTETAQDLVEIGDTAGGGDVDVNFNAGQGFLRGSDGFLGIGTIGPNQKLEVAAALTGGAGSHANEPVVRLTQTADTSYNIGDIHSGIEFYTEDAGGSFPGIQAYIRAETTRANGISNPDAGLIFGTSAGSGGLAIDRMIIDTSGEVGINASLPLNSTLDVGGIITLSGSTGNVQRDVDNAATRMLAATALASGGSLEFYGRDHATLPGDTYLTHGGYDAVGGLAMRHVNTAGSFTIQVFLDIGGDFGIGTVSPTAQLHVDQKSTTGAQPVLLLDQADVSEEMIEFATTIGIGNAIEAVGAKTLTVTHFIKVTLPGALTRYIPVGTIA